MSRQCDKFVVGYGSSELSAIAFSVFDEGKEFQDYQVGFPVPGVEVKVVKSDGHLAKRGERGELYIRSPIRFLGYLHDDEKTSAARTETGWFKSDDSAIITPAGNLIVEGRLSDSIVKTSDGFQSLALLEARLKQHIGIEDAAVVTCVDALDFKRVCYAAVPKESSDITEDSLKDFLLDSEQRIVKFWQTILHPASFILFESFPKTYSGKVNRKALADMCKTRVSETLSNETIN